MPPASCSRVRSGPGQRPVTRRRGPSDPSRPGSGLERLQQGQQRLHSRTLAAASPWVAQSPTTQEEAAPRAGGPGEPACCPLRHTLANNPPSSSRPAPCGPGRAAYSPMQAPHAIGARPQVLPADRPRPPQLHRKAGRRAPAGPAQTAWAVRRATKASKSAQAAGKEPPCRQSPRPRPQSAPAHAPPPLAPTQPAPPPLTARTKTKKP
jgi:hypothetical protein